MAAHDTAPVLTPERIHALAAREPCVMETSMLSMQQIRAALPRWMVEDVADIHRIPKRPRIPSGRPLAGLN